MQVALPMLRSGHAAFEQARESEHFSARQNRNARCIDVTARCG
jgi:hypothetical protein